MHRIFVGAIKEFVGIPRGNFVRISVRISSVIVWLQ